MNLFGFLGAWLAGTDLVVVPSIFASFLLLFCIYSFVRLIDV